MTGQMAVMGKEGDTKIMWDSEIADEVESAREQFDKLVGKGYLAFKTDKKGSKGEQMRTFDPSAERIIMSRQLAGG